MVTSQTRESHSRTHQQIAQVTDCQGMKQEIHRKPVFVEDAWVELLPCPFCQEFFLTAVGVARHFKASHANGGDLEAENEEKFVRSFFLSSNIGP